MTDTPSAGLHHVTALAADPQANLDFWTGALAMSLVKQTVNYDDPGLMHLYYGDAAARPGRIVTFFPLPGAAAGRVGTGQAGAVALAAPAAGFEALRARLDAAGIASRPGERFGEPLLALTDPDGLPVEVIATAAMPAGGLHSVTLQLADPGPVAQLLQSVFGHVPAGETAGPEGLRLRLALPGSGPGRVVDLLQAHGATAGRPGPGTIHHVAFRAADADAQAAMGAAAARLGLAVSAVRDRTYFRSIYFRAPGGVLFEIATDGPGFTVDEPAGALGRGLCLPAALEGRRAAIAAALPPLRRRG